MSNDLFVRRMYKHKGIAVIVEIDFINRTVSLVEAVDDHGNFKRKQWIFAERGLEYMNGWRLILQAIDHAIVEATKVLEELEEKDHKKLINALIATQLPLDAKK
jgi:hypothetical protein